MIINLFDVQWADSHYISKQLPTKASINVGRQYDLNEEQAAEVAVDMLSYKYNSVVACAQFTVTYNASSFEH